MLEHLFNDIPILFRWFIDAIAFVGFMFAGWWMICCFSAVCQSVMNKLWGNKS